MIELLTKEQRSIYKDFLEDKVVIDEAGMFIGNEKIMINGQEDIMKKYATTIVETHKNRVLEVGYGAGVFANELHKLSVNEHIIIDCHPEIVELAKQRFDNKSKTYIIEGMWQDKVHDLGKFDGIFYDITSPGGNYIKDLFNFIDVAFEELLENEGVFTFWYCSNKIDYRILEKLKEVEAEISISIDSIDSENWTLQCKNFIYIKAIRRS